MSVDGRQKTSRSTSGGCAPISATFWTSSTNYPDARWLYRLEQNYRSTKCILDAAGAVVANNLVRKGKTLWTDSDSGEPIGLYAGYDGENEALYIADTIDRLLAQNPKDRVAVLYRTNFQSRQIEEALRRLRAEIPSGRRLQLLPARRSQGCDRVSEAGARAAGFHQPSARHQHACAGHWEDDRRTDGAVRPDARFEPVVGARAHARRPSVPRPGARGDARVLEGDYRHRAGGRGEAAPGSAQVHSRRRSGYQAMLSSRRTARNPRRAWRI